jgi:hypothetical protein
MYLPSVGVIVAETVIAHSAFGISILASRTSFRTKPARFGIVSVSVVVTHKRRGAWRKCQQWVAPLEFPLTGKLAKKEPFGFW